MQPFVLNRHGRLVFPSNVFPERDFSVIRRQYQVDQVVRRDVETKAPTGTEMLRRIDQLRRDMALSPLWTNRFAATSTTSSRSSDARTPQSSAFGA